MRDGLPTTESDEVLQALATLLDPVAAILADRLAERLAERTQQPRSPFTKTMAEAAEWVAMEFEQFKKANGHGEVPALRSSPRRYVWHRPTLTAWALAGYPDAKTWTPPPSHDSLTDRPRPGRPRKGGR